MEEQIKVFLDSNILFSIAFYGKEKSRSYLIYELQEWGSVEVYISHIVSEEAALNIRIKKPHALSFLDGVIKKTKMLADVMADTKIKEINKLPLNDRILLTTAIFHGMDFFITGNDKDFKSLYGKKIRKTMILKPVDFLNRIF
ncbi:MAG: hypothetical protein C0415_04455 [Thermodesulfovibrio sp.]|nr:hypothetical protein [Thermodesulfovibrio sp.]